MDKSIDTNLGVIKKVFLEKMKFLYMESRNDVESQKKTWPDFESKFPSLTGRKMYGLDYSEKGTYRTCSLVLDTDAGNNYGLDQFEFEGGKYMRLRLKHEPPILFEKIGPAYDLLIKNYEDIINWNMPFIEYYKAKNVLDIMVPVLI
ncbi:MAG: hypothetical protein WC925_04990 [Bacilli bacterium]|nr:hypothetical protein [Acholeplasmataceae bacterium]